MGIVMDMSSLEIEHGGLMEREYGEEVMYASWVPVVAVDCLPQPVPARKWSGIPADVAAMDAESFLQKFYA